MARVMKPRKTTSRKSSGARRKRTTRASGKETPDTRRGNLIADSRALWDSIVDRAGLDEKRYDGELVGELASALNVSRLNFRAELVRHEIPVERLLLTFLTLIGPYAAMMRELLSFFVGVGARATAENLRIVFDFDETAPPFDFDLRNFRDWEKSWRQTMAQLLVDRFDALRAGELRHAFVRPGVTYTIENGIWTNIVPRDPAVVDWLHASATDAARLRALPPVPAGIDREVEPLLNRVWALLLATNEPSLWNGDPPLAPEDVRAIVRGAYLLRGDPGMLPRLRDVFAGVEQHTVEISAVVEQLFEVFNLPIWSRRSELYSVWVGARLIGVFGAQARVHTNDRALVFSFRGTHLATVAVTHDSSLAIWCEVRTPASGLIGKGRVNAVQPDFIIESTPSSGADSTALVVECKQYRSPRSGNFAAALVDYARTHRNARVILVNYGPVTPAVAARVRAIDACIVRRTKSIGTFRPGSFAAIEEFESAVRLLVPRAAAATIAAPRPISAIALFSSGVVRLFWEGNVDLDLHCWVSGPDDTAAHIDYRGMDWSNSRARVRLESDVLSGGGVEVLTWEGVGDALLELAVNAYSPGSTIGSAGRLRAEIAIGGETITLEPVERADGGWWWLASIGPAPDAIRLRNVVQIRPPVAPI